MARTTIGIFYVISFFILPSICSATAVAPIPFGTPSDYANNFRVLSPDADGTLSQMVTANGADGMPGILRDLHAYDVNNPFDPNDAIASCVYDTTPADSTTQNTLLGETVRADFELSKTSCQFGLYSRISSAETSGYLADVYLNVDGTNDQIRIFKGGSPIAGTVGNGIGTYLTTSSALNANTFYTLAFTATNVGSSVQLDAEVYAIGGTTPLMSFSVTDSSSAFTSPGEVGMYFDALGNLQADTVDADNFAVVPEPSCFVGVCLCALFLARLRPVSRAGRS